MTKSLKEMQDEVVAVNIEKGWLGPNGEVLVTFGEAISLLHSEASEALEAFRVRGVEEYTEPSGKPNDVGSEFADVLIRLLDDCAAWGIDLEREFERKIAYNRTRPHRHGGKRL